MDYTIEFEDLDNGDRKLSISLSATYREIRLLAIAAGSAAAACLSSFQDKIL